MLRKILAVIAGIITATLIFMGFETISRKTYPLPEGLDKADHEAMSVFISGLPSFAFVIQLCGWAVGSFVCGWLTGVITRSSDRSPAYIAGLFLLSAGIVEIFLLPHPVWFSVTGIALFIPMTLLGHAVYRK